MKIDISPSTDLEEIAPILSVLRDKIPRPHLFERLQKAQENGQNYMIAESADKIFGCLSYHITFDVFWGKTLYIDDLVIDPTLRRKGIGAKLLDAAKSEAKNRSCDQIRLCSGLTRTEAHRFYEANGFAKTSLQLAHSLNQGSS